MQQAGLFAYPVVQGGVAWLNNSAVPPVAANADPTMPASYAAHADVMFQFAARYGKTTVADSLLKLASGQPRSSGLGTVKYCPHCQGPRGGDLPDMQNRDEAPSDVRHRD